MSQTVSASLWAIAASLLGSVSVLGLFRGLSKGSSSSCRFTVMSMTSALGLLVSGSGGVFAVELSGHVVEPFVWDVSSLPQAGDSSLQWLAMPVKATDILTTHSQDFPFTLC